MRIQSLVTLFLAVLFSSSRGLALSIPHFGISSELQTLLSTLEQDAQARFLKLLTQQNREQICNSRIPASYISNETGIEVGDSLSSFSGPIDDNLLVFSLPSIFRNISFVGGNWKDASRTVSALERCPALIDYTRKFVCEVFLSDKPGPRPPRSLAPRLAKLVKSMQKLEAFTLIIPEYHTEVFAPHFKDIVLPEVETLVVGPYCDFAISSCPNVQTISSHGWPWLHSHRYGYRHRNHTYDLIEAAGHAQKLKRLEIDEWWPPEMLDAVFEALPDIEYLALNGGAYDYGIESLIPTLSKFTNLRQLALAPADSLSVGFDPPRCGNAYDGVWGQQLLKEVGEQAVQAQIRVADMVFPACSRLEDLWIGDSVRAEAMRYENGSIADIIWHNCPKRQKVVDLLPWSCC